jgi:uncharacterized membrane protein YcaP (DUF421 family)
MQHIDFFLLIAQLPHHYHWLSTFKMPDDLLHLDISVTEKIIRSIAVYTFLLVVFRIAGKRQLAQINTMDLIVLLTISNTVQNAIIGPDNSLLGGLIGAAALVGVNALLVHFLYVKPEFSKLIEGTSTPLMIDGELLEANLKSQEITKQELLETAQQQGYATLEELETITLETSGNLSFIPKKPTDEALQHLDVVNRLDALSQEFKQLKSLIEKRNSNL